MNAPRKRTNKRSNKRAKKRPKKVDPNIFWGSPDSVPDFDPQIRLASKPSAVITSLGRPPLTGHEAIAEHYFDAVYDRAVVLAGALAAAGGLLEET